VHADFIRPDDPRWPRFLERVRHDVYQLPEYTTVAARYEGGEPVAFYAEDGPHALLMPLLLRDLPADLDAGIEEGDATGAYGYSGPVATPGIARETLCDMFAQFRALARQRSLLTAFIRVHPLRSPPIDLLQQLGTVIRHGPIVYVDLGRRVDEWWAETRSDHRRNLARLIRLGYSVDMDDWSTYPAFRTIYRTTMHRVSASPFYYFSDEYFDDLHAQLGERLHICTVRSPTGEVAASGLFMLTDGIAEYHLGGTAEAHFHNSPSKLMLDHARHWAKERGASVLNLGGGFGGNAGSLHYFKTGFSKSQADFHTIRVVMDDQRYRQLTTGRGEPLRGDGVSDGFFPAYRRTTHDASSMSVQAPL
jgi:hypothetical protein